MYADSVVLKVSFPIHSVSADLGRHAVADPNTSGGCVIRVVRLWKRRVGSFLATLGRMARRSYIPSIQIASARWTAPREHELMRTLVLHGFRFRLVLVMMCCLGLSLEADAQRLAARSVEDLIGELRTSVLRADVSELMPRAAETIEIDLFGERRYYSRGQATLLLNDLLEDVEPSSVRILRSHRTPSAAFVEVLVSSPSVTTDHVWLARYALLRGEWRMRELTVEVADE